MSMIKSFLLSLIIFAIGFVPADARDLSNIDLSVLNNLQNIGSDSIGKQYDSTKVGVQETYQNANKENLE